MSDKLLAAVRAREAARRPIPEPAPEPVKRPRAKAAPEVDDYAAEALARLEEQRDALTVSEGELPGYVVEVERESDDERTFEVPS